MSAENSVQDSYGCDLFAPSEEDVVIENGGVGNATSILNSKVNIFHDL